MRGSYRVGNEIIYPKLLREMGVISDANTLGKSAAQKVSPAPMTAPETQAPPIKAAAQAAAPPAYGTAWPWLLTSCTLIAAVIYFVRMNRQGRT
jgi:hypothetical protein